MDDKDIVPGKMQRAQAGSGTGEEPVPERTETQTDLPSGETDTAAPAAEDAPAPGTAEKAEAGAGAPGKQSDAAPEAGGKAEDFETFMTPDLLKAIHFALADCLLDEIAAFETTGNTGGYYGILDDLVQ